MGELEIELIKELCNQRAVLWTEHARKRLHERNLSRRDVYHAIDSGKIIEQYPEDFPQPSCLISGVDLTGNPLHIVVACDEGIVTVVTAYLPSTQKFEDDYETRKEN